MAQKENGVSLAAIKAEILNLQQRLHMRTNSTLDVVSVRLQKMYDMVESMEKNLKAIIGEEDDD
jgi:hypothetical protein